MKLCRLIFAALAVGFILSVCPCAEVQLLAESPPCTEFSLAKFRSECVNARDGWDRLWLDRKWKGREVTWEGYVSNLIDESPARVFYWIVTHPKEYQPRCAVLVPVALPLPRMGDVVRFTGTVSDIDNLGAIVKVRSLEIVKGENQ